MLSLPNQLRLYGRFDPPFEDHIADCLTTAADNSVELALYICTYTILLGATFADANGIANIREMDVWEYG